MGALVKDRASAEAKIVRAARALCESWHSAPGRTVFDKSRGWSPNLLALWTAYPDAKVVLTVRDLRGIYGSIERAHRRNGLLDDTTGTSERPLNVARSIMGRADVMFAPNGLVGSCLQGIQDVLQRRLDDQVHFVRLEDLASAPRNTLSALYRYLDAPEFEHDLENVQDTAEDEDALYLHKFPHHYAAGPIAALDAEDWRGVMTDEVSDLIATKFKWFQDRFYAPKAETPQRVQKNGHGGGRLAAHGILGGKR